MLVEPRALVRRLTPTATRLLEASVGRAANSRAYEIVVEHLLSTMLEDERGDAARLLHHHSVDRNRLLAHVGRVLTGLRTGNAGRPVFSESLFQWIEDAWVVASVDWGAVRLRSGFLLAQLILRPGRYTSETYPELEEISKEELRSSLEDALAPGVETEESAPAPGATGAGGGAGTPGKPGGAPEALQKFASNFTQRARDGVIDPIFGRHREVRQMIDILARRRKNNPILVGEPGVGKTALVEGLARAIAAGDVPDSLKTVELYGLDLGALQAGAGVKGEFENRLKSVIDAVKASPVPIVLFIDEAHTLIGAGGQAGGSDAANLLKPALARGELRTVAATTWSEFKKYFEKDAALERRFQPVKVEEPDEEPAITMIRGLAPLYEKTHGVTIRDEAVVAAVKLSQRYLSGRQLPDKAVDLLDTASARVKMELATRPDALVALETELQALKDARERLVRDRSEAHPVEEGAVESIDEALRAAEQRKSELQQAWEAELAEVRALQEAQKALAAAPEGAARDAAMSTVREVRAKLAATRGERTLVHPEVDADAVAQVISQWTGIPAGKMKSDLAERVLKLEETLGKRIRGQPAAIRTVAEVIRTAHAGIRNPGTPVGVLLFVGPSGVGKTETAIALADALYGGERFMTSINMSEFQEKHTVSRLVGSPPGYVGYGEGGVLTEAVRQRPYSVVLLDECEKADLEVMNLFYQVFDKGVLNDGEGRSIDFKNTVIVLTSNLGTDQVVELFADGATPTAEEVTAAIRPVLSAHFKPALLARMSIVPYAPIGPEVMKEIVRLKLTGLVGRIESAHGIQARFADTAVDALAARCTESETGARNVDQILRSSLLPELSRELLTRMAEGTIPARLEVGLAEQGRWTFAFEGVR
jgi:type VI secretion system protein VasG